MRLALEQADHAARLGEVPVGALIVSQGQIIATGFNEREMSHDPTAHAELLALRRAAAVQKSWRLLDTTLYVTLEPCPMCAGALVNARVSRLVYGCSDPKAGAARTLFRITDDARLNHRLEVVPGVLAEACAAQLKGFFARLRQKR